MQCNIDCGHMAADYEYEINGQSTVIISLTP